MTGLPILKGDEVDTFVFDAAPELVGEDVVMVTSLGVHADSDAMLFENSCEGFTSELGRFNWTSHCRVDTY